MFNDQAELETLFNNKHKNKELYTYFNKDGLDSFCIKHNLDKKFVLKLLVTISLHSCCDVDTLIGIMNNNESIKDTIDKVFKCIELNLITFNTEYELFFCRLQAPEDILNKQHNYKFALPLINKPEKLTNNNEDIYETYNEHVVLGSKVNQHNKDICLDHINRQNSIQFSLNSRVINKCKNTIKQKPNETSDNRIKKQKNLDKFMKEAEDIYTAMFMHDNKFHLSHKYDKRGRTYCKSYHINPMGNSYQKACVELADKELIND